MIRVSRSLIVALTLTIGTVAHANGTSTARPLGPNEVRAFVYDWFARFDRNAGVEEFLPSLAEKGLWMKFPERTLRSRADFSDWYAGVQQKIASAEHDVLSCDLSVEGTRASVAVSVIWRARARDGRAVALKVRQRWLVSRSPISGQPVIHTYRVEVP